MNKIKKKISKSRKIKKKLIQILQRCSAIKIQCAFRKYRTYWINKDYKSRKLKLTDDIKKFYLSLLYDVEQVNTAPSSYRLNPDSPSVGWTRWAEFRRDRKKRQDYRNVK